MKSFLRIRHQDGNHDGVSGGNQFDKFESNQI